MGSGRLLRPPRRPTPLAACACLPGRRLEPLNRGRVGLLALRVQRGRWLSICRRQTGFGLIHALVAHGLVLARVIAQNICHAAVLAGHSVLFRTASKLLTELHRQTPEGRLRKLRSYANVRLLCIDEVGYLSFDDKSADLLYEVINQRYEQKSLILTTNKPFKEWNEVFPNAACIATMLDRLLHHAEVTVIEGSSYRVRESEQEATARRRRKK